MEVITIDWDEFKLYKQDQIAISKKDNFLLLKEFLKGYYNVSCYFDMYNMMHNDELSAMMLKKRNINSAETLERYFKS